MYSSWAATAVGAAAPTMVAKVTSAVRGISSMSSSARRGTLAVRTTLMSNALLGTVLDTGVKVLGTEQDDKCQIQLEESRCP